MRSATILILLLLAVVTLVSRRPPAEHGAPEPCRFPLALSRDSSIWIECLPRRSMPLESVIRRLEPVLRLQCPGDRVRLLSKRWEAVESGELLRLERPCRANIEPMPSSVRLVLGLPLELNRASRSELTLLPGIGESLARRIVEGRKRGCYRNWRDVLALRGVGPKTVERLKMRASLICRE